ncbi:sugar ABC transporter permease [Acetatifactor sp. DFI.5.50]|uniref:carbohydrate ABC transporter permease n=1 Tax=Waltera sp. TaxID=2815806 RepID=UPI001D0696C7|nr:sugar ABC transporter permease [Lacrimispora saccharolytica]MCG4782574.1 sugar ABC transporter permease [Acetatifactor sp. DFI.5.50]
MKNKKKRVREIADYIKFVFPMLVLYILFFIFPLFQTIGYSFTDYNGINPRKEFTGLTNYVDVFQDKWFYNSMLFTGKSVILMILLANVLGFLLALALNTKIKSRNILRAIVFCPFVFNNVTVGFIWQFLLGRFMTDLYPLTGWKVFNIGWLSDSSLVLYSVVFVKLWQSIGYFMVIYLAGLQLLPQDPLEAAVLDGCTGIKMIRYITIPLMKPTAFVCIFLAITESLNMFPLIMSLTNGGPGHASENISLYIYNEAFKSHRMGYASALAVILTIIMTIIAGLQMKLTREDAG